MRRVIRLLLPLLVSSAVAHAEVYRPVPIYVHAPIYPHSLLDGYSEGRPTLELMINVDGTVRRARFVDPRSSLRSEVIRQSLSEWRFEPLPAGMDSLRFEVHLRLTLLDPKEPHEKAGWFFIPPDSLEIREVASPGRRWDRNAGFPDGRFEALSHLRRTIEAARSLTVYQGTPNHYRSDTPRCEATDIVTIRGFSFYRKPIRVHGDPARQIIATVADTASFTPPTFGLKRCGGFHPDFAVEWIEDEQRHRLLLCFGCNDMKYAGPEATVMGEIESEASDRLRELLAPYAGNEPCVPH